jgi:transketolase
MTTATVLERGRASSDAALRRRAEWIRLRTIDLIEVAGSGHYSSTFSCAELLAVLYYHALRLDPANPAWSDRDRFVLGKGHVAVGLYPCLADLGYFPEGWLEDYTRLGSPLGDHPDMRKVPGVDFSSGSIGHNLSVGVGMALAGRRDRSDHRVVVMLGDGEMNEGQVWEAAMSAAHFELGNLVMIVDENRMGLDGLLAEVMNIEPLDHKLEAFGWQVVHVDGHDVTALRQAFDRLPDPSGTTPTCLIAHTLKGKGVSFMELSEAWHLGFLGPRDRERAEAEIRARMDELEADA